jgi:hypothetical protein
MHGRQRHGVSYYVCETARRQATLVAAEHPKMIYVREDRAVAPVIEFLRTHLFGPGRREGLARALDETDPERDAHHEEAERKSELGELAARIRRQVSHLETLEADTDAGAEVRSRLRELAALKARRERELEAAKRAIATKPDREQAQELVDLLPQLDVDDTLLAEESFREDARRSRLPRDLRADSKRAEDTSDARSGAPARERGRHVVPFVSAPNWTVLEKIPAGRRACAPSKRPSREASAGRIPEARGPMTRSIATQARIENAEAFWQTEACS